MERTAYAFANNLAGAEVGTQMRASAIHNDNAAAVGAIRH
jgi:hypothetical protein